jgi:hypothetical protein
VKTGLNVLDPLGIGSPRAFTARQLETQLSFMNDQTTLNIFNLLLDGFEKEGTLKVFSLKKKYVNGFCRKLFRH